MDLSIGEFSAITGLSVDTLRYYEKEKIIVPARDKSGRRRYSENDIRWIAVIRRLKDTNMPIKGIRKYAELHAHGNSTLTLRRDMLIEHRMALEKEIAILQDHLQSLDAKIEHYRVEIDRTTIR